ncbi:hypothetical protein HPB51_002142 [Rhipicephalus microplus]|uniref:Uncharacterized protein n=1 Tax=Rhipicephalus microplus TaxID=6941 RepID=A0A9J6EQZ3_RHIMP|nr:hypothetical protein HPB51_002142 [Rhipicephalus microplus]
MKVKRKSKREVRKSVDNALSPHHRRYEKKKTMCATRTIEKLIAEANEMPTFCGSLGRNAFPQIGPNRTYVPEQVKGTYLLIVAKSSLAETDSNPQIEKHMLPIMAALHTLLRRASDLFRTSSGVPQQLKPPAADGEVVFCKNNVCVHPPVSSKNGVTHHPGYLTIKVHHDEVLGLSLRLSWIPNASLKKNPRSLENRTPCSSPCRSPSVCTSVCPSPTVHQRHFRRGSTSSGNQPAPDEGSTCQLSCDQQSISSAVSDMGSPQEEQGSLDSWTASDQAEMTASTAGSPAGLSLDPSEGDLCGAGTSATVSKMPSCEDESVSGADCNGSSSSAIGPEEVTAALESMISGLNQIDAGSVVGSKSSLASSAMPAKETSATSLGNAEDMSGRFERNGTAISDAPWKDAAVAQPGQAAAGVAPKHDRLGDRLWTHHHGEPTQWLLQCRPGYVRVWQEQWTGLVGLIGRTGLRPAKPVSW